MNLRITTLVLLFAVSAAAAPLGTEFTYQGVLSDAGSPASGDFDFRFILYDAEFGGSQAGTVVVIEDLTVTDGRMTTQLDFGDVFDGTALWIEVAVRDGGSTGTYTVLSPRQELTAAPFAQRAKSADLATEALNAGALDGQGGTYYLTWSNFIGIPNDIADGDDDTLGDLSCAADEIARWDGAAWNCSGDDDTPYLRTFVVGPVGTPVENGTAFVSTVAAISPPPSSNAPVHIRIEPGTYDFGTTSQPLLGWTTYEGADRGTTVLTSAVCTANFYGGTLRTVIPSEFAAIRHVTIENTCADPTARSIALSNQHDWVRLENVALEAIGTAQHSTALFNSGANLSLTHSKLHGEFSSDSNAGLVNIGAGAELIDVFVEVVGGTSAVGIDNDGTVFTFREGRIWSAWGTGEITGVLLHADADNLRILNSRISVVGSAPVGRGLDNQGADAILRNVEIGGIEAVSLHNWSTEPMSVTLYDVFAFSTDVGVWAQDHHGNGCSLRILGGRIGGGVSAVENSGNSCTVKIGGAELGGGVIGGAVCAGVFDPLFVFYPNTCPPPP